MFKYLTAIVLALALSAATANAQETKELRMTPKNWKLLWTQNVEELKATARMFEHEKSGAPLLYLSCDDDNKVFCIAFRTPPTDSTGISHIMEHSVLCGSEKFPSKEPFVDLLKGSLQTFLNAFTADDRTMYPVASRNDKDFQNLMDVYLDAVFFPNVVRVPEILMQEGWHYEVLPPSGGELEGGQKGDSHTSSPHPDPLPEGEGTLSYNGIVYNEMKGVYSSPQSVLYRTIQQAMYPDSTYAHDSGGNPDNIPDLTQEQFTAFHEKYYHPSNSLIYLYGNGDIEEHLALLHDEFLSKFDEQNVDRARGVSQGENVTSLANATGSVNVSSVNVIPQPPFAAPKDVTAEYSVDPDESTDGKTFLSMAYLLPTDLENVERGYGLDLLTYVLVNSEGGQLRRALMDAGIGLDVDASFDSSILQPCFIITVHNSDPDKKELFLEVLNTTLRKLVEEGIDRKIIEGAINRTEFILREFQVSGLPKGLVLKMQMLETWAYGGDPLSHLRFETILSNIRAEIDNNFFEKLIEEYLLNNTSRGFVMLQPKQGLEKENTEKLNAKLAEIKASLSAEQLEEIKRQKEALLLRQNTPDDPADVAKIPQLELSDVDRQAEEIPFVKIEKEGMPMVNVDVETNGIVYITVLFELQPWMQDPAMLSYFANVLGRLDTENYTYADLSSEIDLHTGGISTGLSVSSIYKETDRFNLHFVARVKTTLPKLEKGLELVHEILTKTKFDDLDRLKEIVQEYRVGLEQSLMSSGHSFARTRSASYFSRRDKYRELTGGIDHYKWLADLEKNFDNEGEQFASTLAQFSRLLFSTANGQIFVTLPKEDFESVRPVLTNFESKFLERTRRSGITITPPSRLERANEAVVIPSRVQYVVKSANFRDLGFEHTGQMLVLTNILRTGYLWNNIRVQGGAYGGGFSADMNGVFSLWSFRDPHLRRTVDVYSGVAEYLENLDLSEEDLTKALIATIGSLDRPMTPSEKGGRVIGMLLSGLTQEDIQRERDEVLSTTLTDLRGFARMFREGMEQNNICVFGNETKLTEESDLFKTTIRPIE